MVQQNELVVFLCSVGVLIFVLSYRKALWRVPGHQLVISAYSLLVAGWAFTILEAFVWQAALNFAEHACHAAAALIVSVWILRLPVIEYIE